MRGVPKMPEYLGMNEMNDSKDKVGAFVEDNYS